MSSDEILPAALALPLQDRAKLARQILLSLDEGEEAEAASEWLTEINRRAEQVENGTASLVDWVDAHAQVRAELASRR